MQTQLGAEASLNDADPDRCDGSELVEWSANRAGVMVNDGAADQYRQLTRHDRLRFRARRHLIGAA